MLEGVDHLVVVAAHPDDESLGAAGLTSAAARAGVPVTVVVATSGEASHPGSPTHRPEDLAALREAEVGRAVGGLAPAARLVLLRLPDGALAGHETALRQALADLSGPRTLLVAPWRGDRHGDHEAAARVVGQVAATTGAAVLEYPVWLWHWGDPRDLAPLDVVRVALDEEGSRRKADALACHASQTAQLSDRPGDEALLPETFLAHATRPFEVFVRSEGARAVEDDERPVTARDRDAAFDAMFDRSEDPWDFETSWYEERKRAVTLAALPARHLGRVLEVGCSTGVLTAELAARAESVVGTDLSERALERARRRLADQPHVSLQQLRAPQQWPAGRFDLIVLSEVGYFWQPDELDEAVGRAVASLSAEGVLLLCHWRHPVEGWPLDGDTVHGTARSASGLEVLVEHLEADFRLDLLGQPGRPTPAAREGRA